MYLLIGSAVAHITNAGVVCCFCCSEVSDDVVLHIIELLLRLSTSSPVVKTTSHQLLLVSASVKPRSDWQVSGANFLAPENLRKLHVQVFCSRKWLYAFVALDKSNLQSIVQSAAEFHDRNLPKLENVLFRPVSGASFLYQKNGARNTVHTSKFSGAITCARNLPV